MHRLAALIMAGGRSERMRTGMNRQHKALRQVLQWPLVEWNLRTLLHFGFREIYIAVNQDERELTEWIQQSGIRIARECGASLDILIELTRLGTIGALTLLPHREGSVAVVNVDNLTDLDLRSMAAFHDREGAAATIASHDEMFQIPYGRLSLEGSSVLSYDEKPRFTVPISSGTYVIRRDTIPQLPRASRLDIPDLIGILLEIGEKIIAYRHTMQWIDINDEACLARAVTILNSRKTWPAFAENLDAWA